MAADICRDLAQPEATPAPKTGRYPPVAIVSFGSESDRLAQTVAADD